MTLRLGLLLLVALISGTTIVTANSASPRRATQPARTETPRARATPRRPMELLRGLDQHEVVVPERLGEREAGHSSTDDQDLGTHVRGKSLGAAGTLRLPGCRPAALDAGQ